MRLARWTLAAALPLASTLGAQAAPPGGEHVEGVVRPPKPVAVHRVPAAHRAHAAAVMDRMLAIALRSPAVNPPRGFDVEHVRFGYAPIEAVNPRAPLACRVYGLIYWQNPQSRLDGAIGPSPVAMSEYCVLANDVRDGFWLPNELWRKLQPASRSLHWEPARTGEVQGHPEYEHARVVVTASPRPIFRPVSRERLLRHELEDHQKALRDMPAGTQPEVRALSERCVREVEGMLAALSPADRAAPGWMSLTPPPGVRGSRCSLMVDEGATHARRIVEENPDFYDAALPATAIQLLVVSTPRPLRNQRDNPYIRHHRALCEGLDYAALAALLGK